MADTKDGRRTIGISASGQRGILIDSNVGKKQVIESYGVPSEKIHVLPLIPPNISRKILFSKRIRKIPKIFHRLLELSNGFCKLKYNIQSFLVKQHINPDILNFHRVFRHIFGILFKRNRRQRDR